MGGIDNVIAALLLSLAAMRRLEVIGVERADNPHVTDAEFASWRSMALRAHNTAALACVVKVLLSFAWFWAFSNTDRVLQIGGLVIFIAWIGVLVWAWRQSTEARGLRERLRIERPAKK
jgi:protein-S-isoprenylcysteine O-methyltransferase Ste14